MNDARFIIQVSKGLIRQPRTRRLLMCYSVLVAMVLLFAGATVLWTFLREHPLLFVGYWFAVGWITILAALLSIYDLAKVRGEARRVKRELEAEYLKKHPHDENPR